MSNNAPAAAQAHRPEMSQPAGNPQARLYRGVWTAVRALNEDTSFYQVRLDAAGFTFAPGQFVQIYRDANPRERSRAYSIASTPVALPLLEFCIKRYPDGLLSAYLEQVKVGDPVTFKGPFGRFKVTPAEAHVFVVTGTGIAPVRSMLAALLAEQPGANVALIQGHRSPSGIFFREEFEQLAQQHASFRYTPVVSRPEPDRATGARGYVTDVLREMQLSPTKRYYLCGNPAMVREASVLLLERNVPLTQIAVEKW